MKIRSKLHLGFLSIALLVVVVAYVSLNATNTIKEQWAISDAFRSILLNIVGSRETLHEYLLSEDPVQLGNIEEKHHQSDELIEMWLKALGDGSDSAEFRSKDAYKTWIRYGYDAKGVRVLSDPKISGTLEDIADHFEVIDKYAYIAMRLHDEILAAKPKIDEEYIKEKEKRYVMADRVDKTADLTLVKDVGYIGYYSKEALFQYRDKKHFDKWLESIETLKTDIQVARVFTPEELSISLRSIDEYYTIAQIMSDLVLDVEQKGADKLANLALVDEHIIVIDKKLAELGLAVATSVDKTRSRATIILIGTTGFSITLALGIAFFVSFSILKPVREFRTAAVEIAQGNLHKKVQVRSSDEIGQLASAFNVMTNKLKESYAGLEEKVEERTRQLLEVNRELKEEITGRKQMEEVLHEKTHDLGERVKELDCLYGISGLVEKRHMPLPKMLKNALNFISSAWQYPEITCVRIIVENQTFKTNNFRETAWKQAADIVVHDKQTGILEVCYLEERPESDEGPFLSGERSLINAISELLGGIIDHKKAEEEVTRVARDLSRIIETVNAPIIGVDTKGLVNEWNQKTADITGYSREEVLGRNFIEDFIDDDYKASLEEVSGKALKGEETANFEFRLKTKDGQLVIVLFTATTRRDALGNIIGVFGIGQDISERKKIEQMKSDFVALASHELRTPLTSIAGYVELILDGDVGEISKEQREFLEIVSQNTQRLETLINDVLDIEKIESGRVKMRQEKVNLNEIVEDCINTFKVMAESKGLKLQKEIKADRIKVWGDSDRLSQVFSNLLSDAIKYTKEGRVKVIVQTKGKFASVAIEDSGVGMSQQDLGRIFTRFFRSDNSYVRKTSGTGLGLSIAKATIEKHNGDIRVESKLGVGTKFEVILPLLKESKRVD